MNIEQQFRASLSPEDYDRLFTPSSQEATQETESEEIVQNLEEDKYKEVDITEEAKQDVELFSSRFSSAVWFNAVKKENITVIGCGGIGSHLIYNLSRLNVPIIHCYDDDTVSEENMSGQMFRQEDIGNTKVSAMYRMVNDYNVDNCIVKYPARYTEDYDPNKIVFCCVDSMSARKEAFRGWKRVMEESGNTGEDYLFIDGRLAAEEMQILCITGNDEGRIKEYEEKWLFSDEEADETVCSYKQTTFAASIIGGLMTNLYINYITNTYCNPIIDRYLPFYTSYSADFMLFKVKNR